MTADGKATGGDGNHILLIFDTMGGPRKVLVRDFVCEVFDGKPGEAKRPPPKPTKARWQGRSTGCSFSLSHAAVSMLLRASSSRGRCVAEHSPQ